MDEPIDGGGNSSSAGLVDRAGLNINRVFNFDEGQYDFAAALIKLLELPDDLDLSKLHLRPDIDAEKLVAKWNMATRQQSFRTGHFASALARFIEEVIAPGMGACAGARIIYQERPSLRIQLPGKSGIKLHTDRDYHHQPAEVNWWVPLTPTFGANTLWLEPSPGSGDFRPVELEPGQVQRFYGNACRHYTETNATSSTRVSFDVRVCRGDMFDGDSPVSRNPKTGEQRFAVGAYYTELVVSRGRPSGVSPSHQTSEAELGRAVSSRGPCDDDGRGDETVLERRGRGKGDGEKLSKAWRSFRDRFLARVKSEVTLPVAVNDEAASNLEVALGDAARAGVAPSFEDPGARAGYTLSHLCPRAGHLANVMMLGSPVMLRIRESLFFGECEDERVLPLQTVASIGGGPGFDAVAVCMVGAFLASQAAKSRGSEQTCRERKVRRPQVLVCDNEPGWAECVEAVAAAMPRGEDAGATVTAKDGMATVAAEASGSSHVSFASADILRPFSDPSNSALAAAAPSTSLFVFAHVVVENARGLLETGMRFIRDALDSAKAGSAFIFTDNTHRIWPAILDLAAAVSRGSGLEFSFEAAFPNVRGKPGYSLALRKVRRADGCGTAGSDKDLADSPLVFEDGAVELLVRFRSDFDRWAAAAGASTDKLR